MYSATLNQTNVSNNNNKFYIVQILQHDKDSSQNYLYTRWGRVGKKGQNSAMGPMNINTAIFHYEDKYREKTKKGDYRELELNFGGDEESNEEG